MTATVWGPCMHPAAEECCRCWSGAVQTIWQSAISPDTGVQPSPASSRLINGEVTQSIKLIPTNQSFIGAPAPAHSTCCTTVTLPQYKVLVLAMQFRIIRYEGNNVTVYYTSSQIHNKTIFIKDSLHQCRAVCEYGP